MLPEQLEADWLPEGPARLIAEARDLYLDRREAMCKRAEAEGKTLPRGVYASDAWWPMVYGLSDPPSQIAAWSNGGGAVGKWAQALDRLEQARADGPRSAVKQAAQEEADLRSAAEQEYGAIREQLHRWADETRAFIEAAPVLPQGPPPLPRIHVNLI